MKKNAMMKIAAILMVAVLLTTCAISSTFAKYVSSDTDDANARVAKWGVVVDTKLEGLFATTYAAADKDNDVVSANADCVVAPGTASAAAMKSTVTGTPEVAVEVSATATVTLENWEDKAGNYYCPLYVTVNDETFYGNTYGNAADFADAIEAEIVKAYNKQFAPNTNLANENLDVEISWEWAFEAKSGDTKQTNTLDSELASLTGKDATISIEITQTVTQLNEYTAPTQD